MSYVDMIWTGLYIALTMLSIVALLSAAGWVAAFAPTCYGGAMASAMIRGCRSGDRERCMSEDPLASWKQYVLYCVPLTMLFWPAMLPALLGRWQLVISVMWLIVVGLHFQRFCRWMVSRLIDP